MQRLTARPRAQASPAQPAPAHYDRMTRWTAAAVHLFPGLCDAVLSTYFGRPRCAWGPCIGVDPVAVVRHAVKARRIRRWRDLMVLTVLCGTLALLIGRQTGRYGLTPALTAVPSAFAGGYLLWRLRSVLRRAAARAWKYLGRHPRQRTVAGLAAVLALFPAGRTIGHGGGLIGGLAGDLIVLVAGAAITWLTVAVFAYRSLSFAARVRDQAGRTAALARPLAPDVEQRLTDLMDTNVVVYDASRNDMPFLGSGQRIRTWKLEVDIKRGAPLATGEVQEPIAFTAVELNRFLDESFIGEQSDTLAFLHRIYVDGATIRPAPGTGITSADFVPHRQSFPIHRMTEESLFQELQRPVDSYRRIYFCLQQTARDGDIVVSVFVRPHIQGRLLFLEIAMHALLPLHPLFAAAVGHLGSHRLDLLRQALRRSTRRLPAIVAGSAGRCLTDVRGPVRQARFRRSVRLAVLRRRPFDFGAGITLREGISTSDHDDLHYNAVVDIIAGGAFLQNRLLGAIREFLTAHRVDTAEFDQTKQSIVNNIQTWNVGQVMADMVGFGNQNQFNAGSAESGQPRPADKPETKGQPT